MGAEAFAVRMCLILCSPYNTTDFKRKLVPTWLYAFVAPAWGRVLAIVKFTLANNLL